MRKAFYPLLLTVLLTAWGCAKLQEPVTVTGEGGKTISVSADNFEFKPNNIRINRGETVEFKITNVSVTEHNFTIKDPGGKILQSVDLPPKQTVPVTVQFSENGTYDFYCDKPLHSKFGMKGIVQVEGP